MLLEEFNTEQVKSTLDSNSGWLLLDFHAHWCGPCTRMTPVLETLDDEFSEVRIVKINSDDEYDLAQKLSVRSIPTLFLFHEGQQVAKWEGGQDEDEIREWLLTNIEEQTNE